MTIILFTLAAITCVNKVLGDAPPSSTNSAKIAYYIGKDYFDYLHYRPIGACVWLHWAWIFPYITVTPEVKHYAPDMIVTVYDEPGDDPWYEARKTFDVLSNKAGNILISKMTGDALTNGHNASIRGAEHNDSVITKSVDVIGSPMNLIHFPYLMLRHDTTAFVPYYQSDLDSWTSRSGLAEAIRPETYNPLSHYIGSSFYDHWAYEFPRSMSVDSNNDYKASLSIALHAADIVTNENTLHVVHSTDDSCGTNCAVSNVIEETHDDHEIWQEVYPHNKHVHLGESDATSVNPIGRDDDQAGNGNYVFAVWRHYKGCVQSDGGHLLWATVHVPDTKKR